MSVIAARGSALFARRSAILLGIWTIPALVAATQLYAMLRARGADPSWPTLLLWQLPDWYLWAAATPIVFWLAKRHPIDRRVGWSALAFHGLAAASMALVHETAELLYLLPSEDLAITPATVLLGLRANLPLGFLFQMVIYAAVLGIGTALAPRGRDNPAADTAGPIRRIPVPVEGQTLLVDVDEIDWIEAADYYARLHVGERQHLVRESLRRLESMLDPELFVRVHRSAIVRTDRIVSIESYGRGDAMATLADGTRVRVSRTRASSLRSALGLPGAAE